MREPHLLILGGLPGTGKTTLASALARVLPAQFLRIDTIEQALTESVLGRPDLEDSGYRVAYALAEESLRLGQSVIADSVNSIEITRMAWLGVAERAGVAAIQIEVFCSDKAEHRRRVERRHDLLGGQGVPDWPAVEKREYEPWLDVDLRLDTAGRSPDEALAVLRAAISGLPC